MPLSCKTCSSGVRNRKTNHSCFVLIFDVLSCVRIQWQLMSLFHSLQVLEHFTDGGIPKCKATVANFSSCKLNADSIYIWCDLHPVSSMQVNRKQMLGIVLSLNSSERDSTQHQHLRLALYLHAKR